MKTGGRCICLISAWLPLHAVLLTQAMIGWRSLSYTFFLSYSSSAAWRHVTLVLLVWLLQTQTAATSNFWQLNPSWNQFRLIRLHRMTWEYSWKCTQDALRFDYSDHFEGWSGTQCDCIEENWKCICNAIPLQYQQSLQHSVSNCTAHCHSVYLWGGGYTSHSPT